MAYAFEWVRTHACVCVYLCMYVCTCDLLAFRVIWILNFIFYLASLLIASAVVALFASTSSPSYFTSNYLSPTCFTLLLYFNYLYTPPLLGLPHTRTSALPVTFHMPLARIHTPARSSSVPHHPLTHFARFHIYSFLLSLHHLPVIATLRAFVARWQTGNWFPCVSLLEEVNLHLFSYAFLLSHIRHTNCLYKKLLLAG